MRTRLVALSGAFLAATLIGCGGGTSDTTPPGDAKGSPPPGSSPEMLKTKDEKKK